MIRVTEMFYSIQGEGIRQGTPSIFVRLWGCSLTCGYDPKTKQPIPGAWKCDSTSSWLHSKDKATIYNDEDLGALQQDIWSIIPFANPPKEHIDLVLTGGEPMLFAKNSLFLSLVDWGLKTFANVYIETNGIHEPFMTPLILRTVKYNCSPKLSNSGLPLEKRIVARALQQIANVRGSCFKFVVNSEDSIKEVVDIVYTLNLPKDMVYLMPEGTDRETIEHNLRIIADAAIKTGFKVSNRFQVQIWNKTMGV